MQDKKFFKNSLHYFTPIPTRTRIRPKEGIPESHELHVSPSACGRRMAITAFRQQQKANVSFLYINEEDIISGCYEDLIPDAVEELLTILKKRPRAILVYVTCIDDLLGTDNEALSILLSDRFPDIRFAVCHINPICMDGNMPPPVNMQLQYYSMLSISECRDRAVNFVGNMPELVPDCEIFEILRGFDMDVKQIYTCETFDEFLSMSKSMLNIVVTPMGLMAAVEMQKTLDIPYLFVPGTYQMEQIIKDYMEIAKMLCCSPPDLSEFITQSLGKIHRTREHIGEIPIIVDVSAETRPVPLAKALLEYGFNVKMALDRMIYECDLPDYEWIRKNHPEVGLENGGHFSMVNTENSWGECLCIGFSSAYTLNATHMVEFLDPEYTYGFHAINILMDKMYEAYDETVDYDKILKESEVW